MGEEFKRAVAQTLIRQEKRIAMLEMMISSLLHGLEEKQLMTDAEVEDLFDSAEKLTEMEVQERVGQVREAFGLTVT